MLARYADIGFYYVHLRLGSLSDIVHCTYSFHFVALAVLTVAEALFCLYTHTRAHICVCVCIYISFRFPEYQFIELSTCLFGFLSEKERQQIGISDVCGCLWMYLADLRASGGSSHVHFNIFYDPAKHDGPLKPPAATLAPTIWPQFHLRWSCPSESQGGELESQWRALSKNYSELAKVLFSLYF